jgi:hypothetical protein
MLSILILTTSACNRGDKVRIIDTTRKYTAATANIEAGLVITPVIQSSFFTSWL